MRLRIILAAFLLLVLLAELASGLARAAEVPKTVESLWADYDPRQEPLDAKVVREWEEGGIVFRYVTYHIGTFKGVPARMAAFYAFPKGGRRLPGLLHLHGGGQRAFLGEVSYYAKRGYACLSINWGGREMENAKPGDPNTDWGAVDPTQNNVPGYFSLKPGPKQLDPVESPRNNNWYLLTIGARRGLTFLEKQPEVDPDRLGVYGLSMGGSLTVYVAGTDKRIKAAVPQVGGSGFVDLSVAALARADEARSQRRSGSFTGPRWTSSRMLRTSKRPLLYLGATNDFNGIMDHTYRTGALVPHGNVRYAFAPHLNHRFTPEFEVTSPLWLDQHLKGTFQFPATPRVEARSRHGRPCAVVPSRAGCLEAGRAGLDLLLARSRAKGEVLAIRRGPAGRKRLVGQAAADVLGAAALRLCQRLLPPSITAPVKVTFYAMPRSCTRPACEESLFERAEPSHGREAVTSAEARVGYVSGALLATVRSG